MNVESLYSVCRIFLCQMFIQCKTNLHTVYVESSYSVCRIFIQCMSKLHTVYVESSYEECLYSVLSLDEVSFYDFTLGRSRSLLL